MPTIACCKGVDELDLTESGSTVVTVRATSISEVSDNNRLRVRLSREGRFQLDEPELWQLLSPTTDAAQRLHRIQRDSAVLEVVDELGWTNPFNRLDVNGDGTITPSDALIIINDLNSGLGGLLSSDVAELRDAAYIDSTGDNRLSPIDALMVINELNNQA